MSEYVTLQNENSDFFIEKKSRFIGYAKPVKTEDEALTFITEIKKKHYDATHNVYAYILRESGLMRFSDDGEPQGTAGIPVLEAMKKAEVTDAVIVATRYFGGTLLGGGGLIRAYSHTASIAMKAAEKIRMKECLLLSIQCDYTLYGRLNSLVPECMGWIDDTLFLENVEIKFHIEPENLPLLQQKIADNSGGQAHIEQQGKKYFPFLVAE
ncbi:YigZ family protein [Scatolibacter rhodanostii]|uniref:YigZ family protein n=1 Tax=Scatolibacter rhodanostii TaxID=2014781 RepID=UPI000C0720E6|nr:YigZ family protein [Scatolibacter rhodanostii]